MRTADADDLVLIAAVWVNPAASDADLVYQNNRAATAGALRASVEGKPDLAAVLAARARPANPYYSSR